MPKFRALVSKFPNNSSRVSATIIHATMRKSFSVLRKGDEGAFRVKTSCYSKMREKVIIID